MDISKIGEQLQRLDDIVALGPQIVGRFYGDGNRLGQREAGAPRPPYFKPERWIGSSTVASNPPHIPSGGVSMCPELTAAGQPPTLKALVADPDLGPRLLGEHRFTAHGGRLLVLVKLLDAVCPIPFHVHADDGFVAAHPAVYPEETFGKDEAYHFLDAPKGECPYTHVGVHAGVTARDVVEAMYRGTDHVIELSPGVLQNFGEGFFVQAGLFHRPGTALTLEIQQPSDVYTFFQTDFGGAPLDEAVLCPGFANMDEAAQRVVNWDKNLEPGLLEAVRLRPTAIAETVKGGKAEWVYPPTVTDKFSGMRLTVQTTMSIKFDEPCVLFVWKGMGTLNGRKIVGGGGPVGEADEFFVGVEAARRGLDLKNTGDEPLVVFALFARKV